MSEQDLHMIERFIAHEMTTEEAKNFEHRMEQDTALRKEVEAYELALFAIREEKKAELKQKFISLEELNKLHKPETRLIPMWIKVAVSAAAIFLILFLTRNTWATYPETLTPEEQNQIFADNFSVYRDETMNPNVRGGDEDTSALIKFQTAFWNGNYASALTLYDSLSSGLQQSDRLRFFKANMLLETNRYDEALVILNELLQDPEFIYADDVTWTIALIHLRSGEVKEGIHLLKMLTKAESKEVREKAKGLLKELRSTP